MTTRPPDATGLPASRSGFGRSVRLAVSVGLLLVLFALADLDDLRQVMLAVRPDLLALMAAGMVAERLFAAYRWLLLLRLAEPGIAYWPVLRVTLISNYLGLFLPGAVGIEALRVYGVSRLTSDLPLALSSVVVERMLGLFSLVSTVAIGLMLAPVELPGVLDGLVAGSLLALLGAGLLLALTAPRRLARRILSISVLARLRQALSGIERRVDGYLHRPGPLLGALVLAFAFQGLRILTVIVGAAALGIDVDPTLLVVIVPVTILVSLLPISMSGLGPREASYVALLGFAGVAPAAALALALTRELLNVATALPGAVLHLQAPLGSRT